MTSDPEGVVSQHPRVLVADDQPLMRWAVQHTLAAIGFDVVCAASGDEARALLRDDDFAAVVTSCEMAGRDMTDVLRILERTQPSLRVVILCGSDRAECVRHDLPRAVVLEKPCEMDAVAAAAGAPVTSLP